jgi:hypothetical protein
MDDQWMAGRPTLDLEDAGDGGRVLGVGGEAIDGLGGHRDDAAARSRSTAASTSR